MIFIAHIMLIQRLLSQYDDCAVCQWLFVYGSNQTEELVYMYFISRIAGYANCNRSLHDRLWSAANSFSTLYHGVGNCCIQYLCMAAWHRLVISFFMHFQHLYYIE